MAYNLRSRRVAYDNIASGSATGRELTITGVSGTSESVRNGELFRSVSGGATSVATLEIYNTGTTVSDADGEIP